MGKVYTRFQTKTAQKPLPNGAVHTYIACIREYPGEGVSLHDEKTADLSLRHLWFSRQMTSEKRAQKFHTDDASQPRSG